MLSPSQARRRERLYDLVMRSWERTPWVGDLMSFVKANSARIWREFTVEVDAMLADFREHLATEKGCLSQGNQKRLPSATRDNSASGR